MLTYRLREGGERKGEEVCDFLGGLGERKRKRGEGRKGT